MKAESSPFVRTIEIKDRSGRVVGSKDVVTYQGLLSKAHDEGLKAIRTSLLQIPSEENQRTAIAKAIVETSTGSFEALGDASPESVTSFLTPHLIRMAETRAKARALRDAVNVGVVSFEELGGEDLPGEGQASDLGSGAPPVTRRNGSPAAPSTAPAAASSDAMTESQRRFLFRLLSSQGLQKEAAHEHLLEHFNVFSLSEVTKAQASSFIDELQTARPREGASNGRGAPVQR